MRKTEVYSWRVTPELKTSLERAAKEQRTSVSQLLELMAQDWLRLKDPSENENVQRRLHVEATKTFGTIALGTGPYHAKQVRAQVRTRVRNRYAAKRSD